ncbi:MAG: DUF1292 domain-containing protein [Candidatus Borkfalkiaceae bacterium]|nr:DUF1292 domain-containing protein [Christensenellaceae bacterium]
MADENLNNVEVEEDDGDLVELVDDQGRVLKFFHVGSLEHKQKWYAFFMPAEEIEGTTEDEVVIFNIAADDKGEEVLLPVEDEVLLEEVYEEFCKQMEEEADAAEAAELEGGCCCCGHDHNEHHHDHCHGEHECKHNEHKHEDHSRGCACGCGNDHKN